MGKKTSFWSLLLKILSFLTSRKKDKEEKQEETAQDIQSTLNEEYKKIDKEKEKDKEKEDFKDVQDDLNNIF
jgi:hypothetical protein